MKIFPYARLERSPGGSKEAQEAGFRVEVTFVEFGRFLGWITGATARRQRREANRLAAVKALWGDARAEFKPRENIRPGVPWPPTGFEALYRRWQSALDRADWERHESDKHSRDSWPGLIAQLHQRERAERRQFAGHHSLP